MRAKLQSSDLLLGLHIDLDDLVAELAACDQVSSIRREIHMVDSFAVEPNGTFQRHRFGLSKHEAHHLFGDDDRVLAVGCVIHVVGVIDGNGLAHLTGGRINRRQTVALVVEDPQFGHIVGRRDVLWLPAHLKRLDHFVRRGINYRNGVAFGIGNVHALKEILHDRVQSTGTIRRINIAHIQWSGHAGEKFALGSSVNGEEGKNEH